MKTVMAALISWIAANSGLPVALPPEVVFEAPKHLSNLMYDDAVPFENRVRVVGVYQPSKHRITLTRGWDAETAKDRSALLHELVHHLQHQTGREYACIGDKEREAYDLQIRWLDEQALDFFQLWDTTPFFIAISTHCAPSRGPTS